MAVTNWKADVQKALARLETSKVFSFDQMTRLVDYLASQKVSARKETLNLATQIHKECTDGGVDFVRTVLARITMAIHGTGNVPDPGGWYFSATISEIEVYVLDRGFSAEWRKLRAKNSN
jgi:hypothetical protein